MSGRALVEKPYIDFADPITKELCVSLWGGADGGTAPLNTRVNNVKVSGVDGELTYKQAANIKTIANSQFRSNTTITSFDELQYFTGLTYIDWNAFTGCSALVSIAIPSSLTSIRSNTFDGCSRLAAVHISDLEAWCNISFGNMNANPLSYGSNHLYLNGEEIKDLVIPNTVTTIKDYAFRRGSSFTSVTIPDSVISLRTSAFDTCTRLTSITIPNSVTSIGKNAFWGCSRLTSLTVLATTPPTLGSGVFDRTPASIVIYVPAESVEAYKAASNWSALAGKIQAIPTA